MEVDEKGIAEIALIENLQRKDLTVWEEADGLAALKDKFGYTQEEIAQKISKGRTTVTELLTIAGLPAEIRKRCKASNINAKAMLLEVARQFDEAAMFEYLDRLAGGKPVKKAPAAKSEPKHVAAQPPPTNHASYFRYSPDGESFIVEVRFEKESQRNKRSVLQALKQAFEDVKNDVTSV
jgi:ParB family chromosome partitioning protein